MSQSDVPLNERIGTMAGAVAKLLREGPKPGTTTEDFLRDLGLAMHGWAYETREMIFVLDDIAESGRQQAFNAPDNAPVRAVLTEREAEERYSLTAIRALLELERIVQKHGERR